jgi:hypothetical protein
MTDLGTNVADFGADFARATGAVASHKGVKQHKVKKATELPTLRLAENNGFP